MEGLFVLIGKIVIEYQKAEKYLNLIVYEFERDNKSGKSLHDKYNKFLQLESKAMGYKLKCINELQIFEEDSEKILNYLCGQRNYVAHGLIYDFDFNNNLDVLKCKENLKTIFCGIESVNKALLKFVLEFNKK